jgi:hypothetical protein
MPRRYIDYPDAFAGWNYVSSIGSYISALRRLMIFLYGVIRGLLEEAKAATIRGARARRRWNGRCPRRRRSTSSNSCRASSKPAQHRACRRAVSPPPPRNTAASPNGDGGLTLTTVGQKTRRHPDLAKRGGDFFALLKPRVMSLVVFTALCRHAVARAGPHPPVIGFIAILCIAVGAGASGALNMWYDADIDAVMSRTAQAPDPRRPHPPGEALAFGLVLSASR